MAKQADALAEKLFALPFLRRSRALLLGFCNFRTSQSTFCTIWLCNADTMFKKPDRSWYQNTGILFVTAPNYGRRRAKRCRSIIFLQYWSLDHFYFFERLTGLGVFGNRHASRHCRRMMRGSNGVFYPAARCERFCGVRPSFVVLSIFDSG